MAAFKEYLVKILLVAFMVIGILVQNTVFAMQDIEFIKDYGSIPTNAQNQIIEEQAPVTGLKTMMLASGVPVANRVLLIQSSYPWRSDANQSVLSSLGINYTQISIDQLVSTDLNGYRMVIIANDQDEYFYSIYRQNKIKVEDFVKSGGTMIFGACSGGWAGGGLSSTLPGNIGVREGLYEPNNYISDSSHPIVSATLSNKQPLTNGDLYSNYCSHTAFESSTLLAGTKIILRGSSTNLPTLMEYPLGNGTVVASGLTWEHNWAYHTGGDGYGTFGRKALDDLFLYGYNYNKPPVINIVLPTSNQSVGETSALYPTIQVSDPNGNTLTCKYYVDQEASPRDTKTISNTVTAQLVSFNTLNVDNLLEGTHTLRFEVSDVFDAPVQSSVSIKVDKTAPVLSLVNFTSTDTSMAISGTATDNMSGMDDNPYRYTVGTNVSAWTSNASYTVNSLTPNILYTAKFEARDRVGHITAKVQSVYTKVQVPTLTVNNATETTLDISTTELNPSTTQYQISTGTSYVDSAGQLTPTATWITLANKKITVKGLSSNTSYGFKAKAKNAEGIETSLSASAIGTTLAIAPDMTFTVGINSITVAWNAVTGATGYDVMADNKIIDNGTATSYTHIGVAAETQHTYKLRVRNAGGTGNWGTQVSKYTLPNPPDTPANVSTTVTRTSITVTWDSSVRATGYDIEVDGKIIDNGIGTAYTHEELTPDTQYTYRVRAKNTGGESNWSELITISTLPNPPPTPQNITTKVTKTTVTVSWDTAERATGYEIEADGMIIDNGTNTIYVHGSLEPASGHTYRVRAKNAGGKSEWSEPLNASTYPEKPDTPQNVMVTAELDSITLTWYNVPYAESYDVEIDGTTIINVTTTTYMHTGLTPDSKHTYRVAAKNISGMSGWSGAVPMSTLPQISNDNGNTNSSISLTNIVAVVITNSITISWDAVALDADYEIEVDGNLVDNGKNTIYSHTELEPNTYHTYKIKVKNREGISDWCAVLSLATMPNPPSAPTGLQAFSTNNAVELRWEKAEGATGYDIEVDGEAKDNGILTAFIHSGLSPGTSHTYRIRAKNITGETAWSLPVVKSTTSPSYIVDCDKGKVFELSLVASNIQDFTGMKFKITYNKDEIEVVDLCGLTPKLDILAQGNIPKSNIAVTYTPGSVEFNVSESIIPSTTWSGEINNIVFKSKIDGQTYIDFKVD